MREITRNIGVNAEGVPFDILTSISLDIDYDALAETKSIVEDITESIPSDLLSYFEDYHFPIDDFYSIDFEYSWMAEPEPDEGGISIDCSFLGEDECLNVSLYYRRPQDGNFPSDEEIFLANAAIDWGDLVLEILSLSEWTQIDERAFFQNNVVLVQQQLLDVLRYELD